MIADTGMIERQANGQYDPIELFYGVVEYFDNISPKANYRTIFTFTTSQSMKCSNGHSSDFAKDKRCLPAITLIVHPEQAFRGSGDASVDVLVSDAISSSKNHRQLCTVCDAPCVGSTQPYIHDLGIFLAIQVVWPTEETLISSSKGDRRTRFHSKPFRISEQVDLLHLMDPARRLSSVMATITGVLCQVGGFIDFGHYASFVCVDKSWWRIDDDRVEQAHSLNDAFENAYSPVLLLYRVLEVKAPSKLKLTIGAKKSKGDQTDLLKGLKDSKQPRTTGVHLY